MKLEWTVTAVGTFRTQTVDFGFTDDKGRACGAFVCIGDEPLTYIEKGKHAGKWGVWLYPTRNGEKYHRESQFIAVNRRDAECRAVEVIAKLEAKLAKKYGRKAA